MSKKFKKVIWATLIFLIIFDFFIASGANAAAINLEWFKEKGYNDSYTNNQIKDMLSNLMIDSSLSNDERIEVQALWSFIYNQRDSNNKPIDLIEEASRQDSAYKSEDASGVFEKILEGSYSDFGYSSKDMVKGWDEKTNITTEVYTEKELSQGAIDFLKKENWYDDGTGQIEEKISMLEDIISDINALNSNTLDTSKFRPEERDERIKNLQIGAQYLSELENELEQLKKRKNNTAGLNTDNEIKVNDDGTTDVVAVSDSANDAKKEAKKSGFDLLDGVVGLLTTPIRVVVILLSAALQGLATALRKISRCR